MTVNHLVPGSIPGAGAINPQNPINKAFQEFQPQIFKLIATFLQQTPKIEEFLTSDMKYLSNELLKSSVRNVI